MRYVELYENTPLRKETGIDSGPIYGYHGTVKSNRGELFFDRNKIHPKDQFLGEGFYFTLDPDIAAEYANIRAIEIGRNLPDKHPLNKGGEGFYWTLDGEHIVSTSSVMRGEDVYGNPIRRGQEILTVDLSGLQNTYFVKSNPERIKAKTEDLKSAGYDSIAFKGFTDRSKQIMVFPEYIDRVEILKREDLE